MKHLRGCGSIVEGQPLDPSFVSEGVTNLSPREHFSEKLAQRGVCYMLDDVMAVTSVGAMDERQRPNAKG